MVIVPPSNQKKVIMNNSRLRYVFTCIFLAAGYLPASAQSFTWTGTSSGVQTSGSPGWALVAPNNPAGVATLWTTGLGNANPSGGQAMDVIISSDFLFTDPAHNVHLILGFDYTPVYSWGYYNGWRWGVEGNQAAALDVGNFSNSGFTCNRQASFEAIYQIPSWYSGGWYWGVSGANGQSPNDNAPCLSIPSFGPNPAGEYQLRLALFSNYDGSFAANFLPPSGFPGFGNSTYNWQSWFAARAGSVPRNTGVALATVGDIPIGKHITVQVMGMSAQ